MTSAGEQASRVIREPCPAELRGMASGDACKRLGSLKQREFYIMYEGIFLIQCLHFCALFENCYMLGPTKKYNNSQWRSASISS